MNKGTVVTVKAKAMRYYVCKERPWRVDDVIPKGAEVVYMPKGDEVVALYRVPFREPLRGVVVGRTCRILGTREWLSEDEGHSFAPEKFIYLWLVEQLGWERYVKPWAVLDEDLAIEEAGMSDGKVGKGAMVMADRRIDRWPISNDPGYFMAPPPPEEDAKEVFTPLRDGWVDALYTFPLVPEVAGIVIGRTMRTAGCYTDWEHSRPRYKPLKHIPVWLVEPTDLDRWLKPLAVLEKDLIVQS